MSKEKTITIIAIGIFFVISVLVTVMVVLFSGPVAVSVTSAADQMQTQRARTEIKAIEIALNMYRADYGDYPKNLAVLRTNTTGMTYYNQPLLDPWNTPYKYASPTSSTPGEVWSAGPDRVFDTPDDI